MILIIFALVCTVVACFIFYRSFSCKKTTCCKKTPILTFLGAPGSGKGTIAQQCIEHFHMQVLSTGNLCRQAVARGDEHIKKILNEGKLIPDETISDMVKVWLKENSETKKTIILDGYPRTERQAELLTTLISQHFPQLGLHVISLNISDEAIIDRISNRLMCENKACQSVYSKKHISTAVCPKCGSNLIQREDDKEEIVRKRLEVYAHHNNPLVSFYKKSSVPFHVLDVENKSIEEVFKNFEQLYKSIQ